MKPLPADPPKRIIPREDLRNIKICTRHAELVYHDEPICPCCRIVMEVVLGRK